MGNLQDVNVIDISVELEDTIVDDLAVEELEAHTLCMVTKFERTQLGKAIVQAGYRVWDRDVEDNVLRLYYHQECVEGVL